MTEANFNTRPRSEAVTESPAVKPSAKLEDHIRVFSRQNLKDAQAMTRFMGRATNFIRNEKPTQADITGVFFGDENMARMIWAEMDMSKPRECFRNAVTIAWHQYWDGKGSDTHRL